MNKALEEFAKSEPCLLCGGMPSFVALYIPGNDLCRKIVDEPKGKKRVVAYTLCDSCRTIPDHADRCEKKIFATFLLGKPQ